MRRLMCLLGAALLMGGCGANPKAELKVMMESQVEAMNREDVVAYMKTVDPEASFYSATEQAVRALFAAYDLKATLDRFEVVSASDGVAEIRTVISMRKLRGFAFKENKVTALHSARRLEDRWVIRLTKVEKFEGI